MYSLKSLIEGMTIDTILTRSFSSESSLTYGSKLGILPEISPADYGLTTERALCRLDSRLQVLFNAFTAEHVATVPNPERFLHNLKTYRAL